MRPKHAFTSDLGLLDFSGVKTSRFVGLFRPERAKGRNVDQLKLPLATDKPENNWDQHDAVNNNSFCTTSDNADGPHPARACVRVCVSSSGSGDLAPQSISESLCWMAGERMTACWRILQTQRSAAAFAA